MQLKNVKKATKQPMEEEQLDMLINQAGQQPTPWDTLDDKKKKPMNIMLTEKEIAMIDAARELEGEEIGGTRPRQPYMKAIIMKNVKARLGM